MDNERIKVGFWRYWLLPLWSLVSMTWNNQIYRQETTWDEWYEGTKIHRAPKQLYLRKVKLND